MTNAIRELRLRWQNHRQALLRADYNHADEELARTLHFADQTPIIAAVLQELRLLPLYHEFDVDNWLDGRDTAGVKGARRTNLGFSLDEKERAAQCLKVLEWSARQFDQGQQDLMRIGSTTYGGGSSRIIDRIRSAIDTIFEPFYYFVDSELRFRESLITPTDIMSEMQNLVDSEANMRYPQTHKLLVDTYRQLFTLSTRSSASWYQVGYSCRQTLVRFANEVFDPSYVPKGEQQPNGDDAKSKLKWAVRYHLRNAGVGDRYRQAIEGIVQANWNFVSNVGHREESVTERDARLAVIYTYLTIWLVDGVLNDQRNASQDVNED